MPLYRFKCVNTACKQYNEITERYVFNPSDIVKCDICNKNLLKIFPLSFHVKGVEREVDGKDLGKVTQEKNEKLKQKWSGYSYEEQNLRKKVNKMAEERLKKK